MSDSFRISSWVPYHDLCIHDHTLIRVLYRKTKGPIAAVSIKMSSDIPGMNTKLLQIFDNMALPPFLPMLNNPGKRVEAIRDLDTRDNDVILLAFPKSGTHWTWEVLCMLVQGKADYIKSSKGNVFLEAMPDLNLIEQVESPRVLNTHVPLRWLPQKHVKNGGKVVHVIRNPKDVAVSVYHHLKSSGEAGPGTENMSFSDYLKMQSGKAKFYGGWFAYEKEIEEAKKNGKIQSIHTLHYEDMKRDPEKEIRRLAEYLQVECSEQLVKDIADKTTFKNMKKSDEFKDNKLKNITRELHMTEEQKELLKDVKFPRIYRKGEVGDWKNFFTVAQNEQFDAEYAVEMKNVDINLTFEL